MGAGRGKYSWRVRVLKNTEPKIKKRKGARIPPTHRFVHASMLGAWVGYTDSPAGKGRQGVKCHPDLASQVLKDSPPPTLRGSAVLGLSRLFDATATTL